jgi:hypothetical protein
MLEFLILAGLILWLAAAVRSCRKHRGGCGGCDGCCEHCGGCRR